MDNKAQQQKITSMAIDAKCILDYDLTIMKIFQYNYNHPDYVDQKVMHYSLAQLRNALVKRKDTNPLTICIPEGVMTRENLEQILMDIYKNNEYDIYKYITVTGTSKLIYMMNDHSSFDVTVVCKDETEKGLIEGRTKSFKTVIGYDSIDPKDFNSFMFKDVRDVFALPYKLEKKTLFFQNYEFNITRDTDGTPVLNAEYGMALVSADNYPILVEVYDHNTLESLSKERTSQ
jgi:hypothetical protein